MAETLTVKQVRDLAASLFEGKTDKGGRPYIGHLEAVALSLAPLGEVYEMAGLLHDVIEDTGYTGQDLLDEGVPYEVVRLVQIVTRAEGETYEAFIQRIAQHPPAIPLKIADVLHNLDPSRPGGEALRTRYHAALKVLTTAQACFAPYLL